MKAPLPVRIGLLGVKVRATVITRIWLGYLLAITTFLTAERSDVLRIALAILLAGAATWATASLKWMDRHDRWPRR